MVCIEINFVSRKDYSGSNAGLKFTDITYTSNGNILACGFEKGNAIVKQIQPAKNIQKVKVIIST